MHRTFGLFKFKKNCHNEIADQCKTKLNENITHNLFTKRVKAVMGENGEWEITSIDESVNINALTNDYMSKDLFPQVASRN
jgi:hypothetical protein